MDDYIKLSMCDMLKIGIGSSSSHTLAPWLAASEAIGKLNDDDRRGLEKISVKLFGPLAYGGRGHYTTVAIPLGFLEKDPSTFDINEEMEGAIGIKDIRDIGKLEILNIEAGDQTTQEVEYEISFEVNSEENDGGEEGESVEELEKMEFVFQFSNQEPSSIIYYSYGGGSYGETEEAPELYDGIQLTHQYNDGEQLQEAAGERRISELLYESEIEFAEYRKQHPEDDLGSVDEESKIVPYLLDIAQQMGKLIYDGITYDDNDGCYDAMYVNKKAKQILTDLLDKKGLSVESTWQLFFAKLHDAIERKEFHGGDIIQLVGGFALAVSEQNAALKNVVTAPTNGSCGVIPAALYFYVLLFSSEEERDWLFAVGERAESPQKNNIVNFLLVANAIGGIIKSNASISGGVGGCQAEIGTAAAMAAGGLLETLGSTPASRLMVKGQPVKYSSSRVLNSAAAALKHYLGSTCDPVGGLVEIPCVERNLAAVATAIAISYEMFGLDYDYTPKASFDVVVEVMKETGEDMHTDYKETSLGGLAKALEEDVIEARPDLFPDGTDLACRMPRYCTGC